MGQATFGRGLIVSGILAASCISNPAWAQDEAAGLDARTQGGLEDIVVTARKREENLQTTPISITAISQATLNARGITSVDRIDDIAPNVASTPTSGALGAASHYIRGIGYGDLIMGQDPAIGIYIDGVYNGRNNNSLMELVSLERVEVLRGPQGTLFGRNTIGGAISIVTREPRDEFGADLKFSYGSYAALGIRALVDSGEIGGSGIKLSAGYQHRQQDGYIDNRQTPDDEDPNAFNSDAYWIKAVGKWGAMNVTVSGDYNDLRGYPSYFQIRFVSPDMQAFLSQSPALGGNGLTITRDYQRSVDALATAGEQRIVTKGASATIAYDLNDALTLKSISAYRGYRFHPGKVAYGLSNLVGRFGATVQSVNGLYSDDRRFTEQSQFSQEVQMLGDIGSELNFVLGGFYFSERGSETSQSNTVFVLPTGQMALLIPSSSLYRIKNRSLAMFGQVNWKPGFMDNRLEITGGLRYTEDKKRLFQIQPVTRSPSLKSDDLSVLASLSYQWTDALMSYARFATGYRAGGFNTRAGAGFSNVFQPEKVTSYEAGFKAELLDRHLRLNAAAFYTNYRDIQLSQFLAGGVNYAFNGKAHIQGFEFEAEAAPMDGLILTVSFGYVDPKFDSIVYPAPATGVADTGCVAGPAPGTAECAPIAKFFNQSKVTANVGFAYQFPESSYGKWSMRADYSYKGKRYFTTNNLPNISPNGFLITDGAYGVLSGRVSLSDIPLGDRLKGEISLYGQNLTNTVYANSGIDFGQFAGNVIGDPRTIGVEFSLRF